MTGEDAETGPSRDAVCLQQIRLRNVQMHVLCDRGFHSDVYKHPGEKHTHSFLLLFSSYVIADAFATAWM